MKVERLILEKKLDCSFTVIRRERMWGHIQKEWILWVFMNILFLICFYFLSGIGARFSAARKNGK